MGGAEMEHKVDAELFLEIKKGSEAAFYELYNRHWEALYIIAKSILKDGDLAEDIIQDVFTDFWERRGKIINGNIKAYLSQSVRYQVFKQLRKVKLSEIHLDAISSLSTSEQSDDRVIYKELQTEVDLVVNSLPKRCREIFHLSRNERLTNKEIAERLNISVRTVETQISIALKQLKSTLTYLLILYIQNNGN